MQTPNKLPVLGIYTPILIEWFIGIGRAARIIGRSSKKKSQHRESNSLRGSFEIRNSKFEII
jgi:hypothetical protein